MNNVKKDFFIMVQYSFCRIKKKIIFSLNRNTKLNRGVQ